MGKKRVGNKGGVGGKDDDGGSPCPVPRCREKLSEGNCICCPKCCVWVCKIHQYPDDHFCGTLKKKGGDADGAADSAAAKPPRVPSSGGLVVLQSSKAGSEPETAAPETPKLKRSASKKSMTMSSNSLASMVDEYDESPPEEMSAAEVEALGPPERAAHVEGLVAELSSADAPARKQAAWRLAGAVAALGVRALTDYGVIAAVQAAVADKKSADVREGGAHAARYLVRRVGRRFEPFAIPMLPGLVALLGDGQASARDAGDAAVRALLKGMSPFATRQVLPHVMDAAEHRAWRVKESALGLLGVLASQYPSMLNRELPKVLPRVKAAMSDTHPKVAEAALDAFREVTGVLRNPEILALRDGLIAATHKPESKTEAALNELMELTFANPVDAASLALVVPVLTTGLKERKSDLKKKAAKTTGNMCALVTSPQDMAPFVPMLLPELKKALVDQTPDVRSFSCWAIASLLQGMGARDVDAIKAKIEEFQEMLVGSDPKARAAGEAGLQELVDKQMHSSIKRCTSAPSLADAGGADA